MTEPVPVWMRWTGAASVALVALVAAVVSYAHLHTLAERAGEGWRAWLLPLSVDGLLVAASLAMVALRRSGRSAGWLPWLGLLLGLAVSLAANMAAAQPTLIGRLVASWPPVALGIAFELLLGLGRPGQPAEPAAQPRAHRASDRSGTPKKPADRHETEPPGRSRSTDRPRLADRSGVRSAGPTGPMDRTDEQLLTQLRPQAARLGRRPSRNAVMTELRVGTQRANRLLDQLDHPDRPQSEPDRLHAVGG